MIVFQLFYYFLFLELKFDGLIGNHPRGFAKVWSDYRNCRDGSFVDGLQVKYNPLLGLTSLVLDCSTFKGNRVSR